MRNDARRRRSKSRDHYRPLGVIGFALAVHVAFLTFASPPRPHAIRVSAAADELDTFEGVGGTFVYDGGCMDEVLATAFVRAAACYVPWQTQRRACLVDALAWYRVATVGCNAPDEDTLASFEDSTPVVDADALDLAMLEVPLDQLFEQIKQEKLEENLRGQVVETPAPLEEKRPDKYEYLAEHDSAVDKQTVKRGKAGEPERIASPPMPEPAPAPAAAVAPTPPSGALSMRRPGAPGAPATDATRGAADGMTARSLDGIAAMRGTTGFDHVGPVGQGGEDGGPPGAPGTPGSRGALDLRPTPEILDKASGGNFDHLEGVEEGEQTALNTRKWKYASFFNRVKRQVAQNWHPEDAYRLRDPNGNIYGTRDRMTVLTVSLEPDGTLHKIVVTAPSGVDFLDDEAIKAFELAEPFPNPPAALVDDGSNLIVFRFGFSFEINSRTPWRVFRYQ